VGEETGKRGDEWWGDGGEYEGVDEGEIAGLQLLSLLHMVGFVFFFFPSPISALREAHRLHQKWEEECFLGSNTAKSCRSISENAI
jgi:hypothetical protein